MTQRPCVNLRPARAAWQVLPLPGGRTGPPWDAVRAIRTRVFLEEQNIPPEEEWDELDLHPATVHLLLMQQPTTGKNTLSGATIGGDNDGSNEAGLGDSGSAHSDTVHGAAGAARCFLDPAAPTPGGAASPAWRIGRMAVLPRFRGRGGGLALLQAALELAPPNTRAILSAQTHAIPFYRKAGFYEFGEIHMDAGIPHRWMERRPG